MRKCTVCNHEWPDAVLFCGVCGGSTEEVPTPAYVAPEGAAFVPVEEETPIKKKSLKGLWLALVAVVLCGALVTGFITNWFGLFSPWSKVGRAALRVFKADSATIAFRMEQHDDGDDGETIDGTLYVVLDEDAEEITGYMELNNGGSQVVAIDGDRGYEYTTSEDNVVTSAEINEVDSEEFFDMRDEFLDALKERDTDWEDVIDDLGWEDYLDEDEMDKFVRQLNRKYFGNTRWLKKNMGYSRKGNTISFDIDPEKFLEALLDIVDDSDAFTRQGKREIGDALEEALDALDEQEADVSIKISFTVKGLYLSNVHMELSGEVDGEEGHIEVDADISDVNKTEVTRDEIRDVRSIVDRWLEAEGIIYDECEECSDFGEVQYYQGEYLCDSCYYERRYDYEYEYDW